MELYDERMCDICHKIFYAKTSNHKRCSDECRKLHLNLENARKALKKKNGKERV